MNREEEYRKYFTGQSASDDTKIRNAHAQALDIRKFEIGLYWQRAAYFWALIAGAFAGYFAILGAEHLEDKQYLAFVVACIGLVFTWAWFLVNRGSKFWQENWENHVDMLEDEVTGPLYKTVLSRRPEAKLSDKFITGPLPISVSKVNQWVSSFALCIWLTLLLHALPKPNVFCPPSPRHIVLIIFTFVFALLMFGKARTHEGSYEHVMSKRETKIV